MNLQIFSKQPCESLAIKRENMQNLSNSLGKKSWNSSNNPKRKKMINLKNSCRKKSLIFIKDYKKLAYFVECLFGQMLFWVWSVKIRDFFLVLVRKDQRYFEVCKGTIRELTSDVLLGAMLYCCIDYLIITATKYRSAKSWWCKLFI